MGNDLMGFSDEVGVRPVPAHGPILL